MNVRTVRRGGGTPAAQTEQPLVEVTDLYKSFRRGGGGLLGRGGESVKAVDGVSLSIRAGQTLGIVGESGSGKSTTGRLLLRLIEPDSGQLRIAGQDVLALRRSQFRKLRRDMQMIFQDPYASLDPTKTIGGSVGEPMKIFEKAGAKERDERVRELLGRVGLRSDYVSRYPAEMSGGQRQRVAIARALALNPKLIIADEAVSALDVSTQSEVLNLMRRLQREMDLTYLFISHNLSVVRHMSDRIAVMYLGRIVEAGPAEQVYLEPLHPYTQALLSAIPLPDPVAQRNREKIVLAGDVPDPANPPAGCNFVSRCPYAMPVCHEVDPVIAEVRTGSGVACHLHDSGPKLQGATVRGLRIGAGGAGSSQTADGAAAAAPAQEHVPVEPPDVPATSTP